MRATTGTNNPMPSWNEGGSKQAITNFVNEVTTTGKLRPIDGTHRRLRQRRHAVVGTAHVCPTGICPRPGEDPCANAS